MDANQLYSDRSNFEDLSDRAKETAIASSTFRATVKAELGAALRTQNSNGEVMTIPPEYLRSVRLQNLKRDVENSAKACRMELVLVQ